MTKTPGVYFNKALGMASPQIGYHKRFILFADLASDYPLDNVVVCVNPRIVKVDGRVDLLEEGCLSAPQ